MLAFSRLGFFSLRSHQMALLSFGASRSQPRSERKITGDHFENKSLLRTFRKCEISQTFASATFKQLPPNASKVLNHTSKQGGTFLFPSFSSLRGPFFLVILGVNFHQMLGTRIIPPPRMTPSQNFPDFLIQSQTEIFASPVFDKTKKVPEITRENC